MPDSPESFGVLGRQDLHVHTTMSDGHLTLAEVVSLGEARGIEIGIADHVSTRNSEIFVANQRQLAEYLAATLEAPVFRSAELCWDDPFSESVARELADQLDYLIGSNHGFRIADGVYVSPWTKSLPTSFANRPHEVMEIMVDTLCDIVTGMPIDIVAHSTVLPPALLASDPDPEVWWTEEREDRFVAALVGSGVAMEISNRYQLPHDRILRKALDAGAFFSLGSDGHTLSQVAQLGWAMETARRVGVSEDQLFVVGR